MEISQAKPSRENHALNALRATAALLVVVSHLRNLLFVDYDQSAHSRIASGFYVITGMGGQAVGVFFVLSGYWVGGSVIRQVSTNTFTWRRHAAARLTRLWLVLIPALALTALVDQIGRHYRSASDVYLGAVAYHNIVPTDPGSNEGMRVLLGNVFFLQRAHVPTFGTDSPLWSLAYEFAYYAMFPMVLLALARITSTRMRLLYLLLILCSATLFGPNVMLSGLIWLCGAAVAWQAPKLRAAVDGRRSGPLQISALIVLMAGLMASKSTGNSWLISATVALPAALLVITLLPDVNGWRPVRFLVRLVARLAKSSYSLYAIHCPVAVFATAFMIPRATDRWHLRGSSALILISMVCSCLIIAYLFACATENRTEQLRNKISMLPNVASWARGYIVRSSLARCTNVTCHTLVNSHDSFCSTKCADEHWGLRT